MKLLDLARRALQDPDDLRTDGGHDTATTMRLVLVGAIGATLFGAVAGTFRGDLQILYGALKMPVVLALPWAVSLPMLLWLRAAAGDPLPWPRASREVGLGVARMGSALVFMVPVVWVIWSWDPRPQQGVMLVAGAVAVAYLAAVRGLFVLQTSQTSPWAARVLGLGLVAMMLGQASWMLRPFVGRPDAPVALFAPADGNFVHGAFDATYPEARGRQSLLDRSRRRSP